MKTMNGGHARSSGGGAPIGPDAPYSLVYANRDKKGYSNKIRTSCGVTFLAGLRLRVDGVGAKKTTIFIMITM